MSASAFAPVNSSVCKDGETMMTTLKDVAVAVVLSTLAATAHQLGLTGIRDCSAL
jgi:hypothetical protein